MDFTATSDSAFHVLFNYRMTMHLMASDSSEVNLFTIFTTTLCVTIRIHRYRSGVRHICHRPGHSNLSGYLHRIQHQFTDPQPHPGQCGLSRDTGYLSGTSCGEIQLPHQRGKRMWEQLLGECYIDAAS